MANDPTNPRDALEDEHRFRPKIGRARPAAPDRGPTFRVQVARLIAKQGGRKSGKGRTASKLGHVAVRAPHALSRRCVIKARYIPIAGNGRKLAKAHLAYLERDGVERDGSPGRLYGSDQNFDADAFRAPVDGEPRQFRFIVSPEDAHLLNLTEFTRQFMKQVEKDTARRLDWAAVNHHNTDNPHVHIVVRGLDRAGDEVRIDGRYIAREMRWRAQEIATRELGPRLEMEFSLTRNAEVERARLTEYDRAIDAVAKPDGTVSLQQILAQPGGDGRLCIARLETLEVLQLARVERPGVWRLAEGWKESLQRLGEYQDVLDRLKPLVGNRAVAFQVVDERNQIEAFEGRVIGKGLDDELGGKMFAAVQAHDGRSFYVRLAPDIAEALAPGDTVRVGVDVARWLRPADLRVARFAELNGGIYDPARHQRELENLPRARAAANEPTPAQRVAANVNRLERLERYKLVTRLPDGRWQIRPDLVSQLQDRERTHPQYRMRVERTGPERAPAPTRDRAPEISERAALGQALAKDLRLTYVSNPPTFKGRLLECTVAPSGREYARVVDDARGEFTVIPKPPEWDRMFGRTIRLSRDREQKLVIQRDLGLSR
jgi:type IV secretory pathway VirD2 relaxase